MGLLGSLVKSSIEGVVIELDKGNTPYVVGEEVNSPPFINSLLNCLQLVVKMFPIPVLIASKVSLF